MTSTSADIIIFTGPTLAPGDAAGHLDATFHPPVAQGDVIRAALGRPRAIGIIDGVFDRLPAVWHKEILWAMSRGVAVYGASSMGALRAAELDVYGMRGVGSIYSDFASGRLEDDDEVAVVHADHENEYRNLSDALVDIRATMAAAVDAAVIDVDTAASIVATAKAQFYGERHLAGLLAGDALRETREWVKVNRVSQKRLDAIEMLRVIGEESAVPTAVPDWAFQHSQYWDEAYRRVVDDGSRPDDAGIQDVSERDHVSHILDEARMDPVRYRALEDRALLMILATQEAHRTGINRSAETSAIAVEEVRMSKGITTSDDVASWLNDRGLTNEDLSWIADRWGTRRWVRRASERGLASEIIRELKEAGEFADLAARADRKRASLAGGSDSTETSSDDDLVAWYFRGRHETVEPKHLDAWVVQHGWRDRADFLRALRRERHFDSE